MENFVLSVFAKIDKEDRTDPTITKNHALSFKRCGDFIQVLSLFGQLEPEWAERAKYCNFKAGIILKCLKNGEEPPRGNPFAQEEEAPVEEPPSEEVKADPPQAATINSFFGGTPNPGFIPDPIVMPPSSYPGQDHFQPEPYQPI